MSTCDVQYMPCVALPCGFAIPLLIRPVILRVQQAVNPSPCILGNSKRTRIAAQCSFACIYLDQALLFQSVRRDLQSQRRGIQAL